MKNKPRKHTIDIVFVITLFCVFAVSVIMLTGTGAGVYQKIVNNMREDYDSRVATSYLFNKIHRADADGCVSVGRFNDSNALLLTEEIKNVNYCTYIYFYDGNLMEMFTRLDQKIDPSFGNKIMSLSDYKVEQISPTLYHFDFTTTEGIESSLYVHTRTASDTDS